MRLIDADALCMGLTDWQYGDFARVGHETEYDLIDKVLAGISAAPTIDAVPVVRCRECKWWKSNDCKNDTHGYVPLDENGFCSHGERLDGADNG